MSISRDRLKKLAKFLMKFFNVFFWLLICIGIAGAIMFIASFFLNETNMILPGMQGRGFLRRALSFQFDPETHRRFNIRLFLQALMPLAVISISVTAVVLRQVGLILKTVVNDQPFEEANSKRLTVISVALMSGSLLSNIAEFYLSLMTARVLNVPSLDIHFSMDIQMFLIGLLLLILAGVFKYGSYLQQEYDATL